MPRCLRQIGGTVPHATMTEAALADAFDQVREPAMSARARTLAGQIGRDGAGIGAKRLAADYG